MIKFQLSRFFRRTNGSIALSTGLLLSVFGVAGLYAMDYSKASQIRADLQSAADSAALASARQLPFILVDRQSPGTSNQTLTAISKGMVDTILKDSGITSETDAILVKDSRVRVDVTAKYNGIFGQLTGLDATPLSASATAESYGGDNICVVSIDTGKHTPGLEIHDSAHLDGRNCGVYSASSEPDSILATGSGYIDASFICSAGGYVGDEGNFSTGVTTDCPQIGDPLQDREPIEPDHVCEGDNLVLTSGAHTLNPGTYCNGLTIGGTADVWLNPGEYVFTKGPLIVSETARFRGTRVGLFFDDKKSHFEFRDDAEIDIAAPVDGAMAGVVLGTRKLCAESTKCKAVRPFVITSSQVRSLLGTVHIPLDEITIDTTMPVSSEAAFTIIVVGNMFLRQSPTLVLNTNYDATDVPVPAGFAGASSARIVN